MHQAFIRPRLGYRIVHGTILLTLAATLLACGGSGGSGGSPAPGDPSLLPFVCPLFFVFIGELCVEDPNNPPPDGQFDGAQIDDKAHLTAEDPVGFSVMIHWTVPAQYPDGSLLDDLAGFVINIFEYNAAVDAYFGYDSITIDNPGILDFIVDIPDPNRYLIMVVPVGSGDRVSRSSNAVTVGIPGPV